MQPPDVVARLDAAVAAIRARWTGEVGLGVVAGSGLGALGELVSEALRIPFAEIPFMPSPSVVGHSGELLLGRLEGLPVAVLSGRVHVYEGHPMVDVVHGVRLLARLGAPAVLLTNAAGGVHPWMPPGTLCRLVDHINLQGVNPLAGPNDARLGARFPDMSEVYSRALGARIDAAAAQAGVGLEHGVYAAFPGPSYETPAEVRMARALGAATVGMSTVPEAIALRHMGVAVAGISVVTNFAAGVVEQVLDHAEVKDVALVAGPRLLSIVRAFARGLVAEPLT
jgi:purine-nucleoside phosphorylase